MRTSTFLLVSFGLSGCGGEEPSDCAAGFTLGADGLCYEVAPPGDDDDDDDDPPTPTDTGDPTPTGTTDEPVDVEDVLASLPRCRSEETGDGDLDLARGCAAGVCVGDSWEDLVAALGEPTSCETIYFEFMGYRFGQLDCLWAASGIGTTFGDDDFDGVADDGGAYGLDIEAPYAGATADGLGIDDEVSCFVERADPGSVTFDLVDRDWYATYLSYDAYSVVDYLDNASGAPFPDGRVDRINLYGF